MPLYRISGLIHHLLITFRLLIRGPLIGDLFSTSEYIHFLNVVFQFLSSLLLLKSLLMLVHLLSLASCCCRRPCTDVVTTVGSLLTTDGVPKVSGFHSVADVPAVFDSPTVAGVTAIAHLLLQGFLFSIRLCSS
jgi:hypothetical protein